MWPYIFPIKPLLATARQTGGGEMQGKGWRWQSGRRTPRILLLHPLLLLQPVARTCSIRQRDGPAIWPRPLSLPSLRHRGGRWGRREMRRQTEMLASAPAAQSAPPWPETVCLRGQRRRRLKWITLIILLICASQSHNRTFPAALSGACVLPQAACRQALIWECLLQGRHFLGL